MLPSARGQGRVSEATVHRIKQQISKGRLLAGHKLPAERKLARQFKTSRSTSHKQLTEARMLIEPPIA